ncbi:Phosphatidylinositol 4-phosphate 5-kinase 1 [Balamuthia mandrillaris]
MPLCCPRAVEGYSGSWAVVSDVTTGLAYQDDNFSLEEATSSAALLPRTRAASSIPSQTGSAGTNSPMGSAAFSPSSASSSSSAAAPAIFLSSASGGSNNGGVTSGSSSPLKQGTFRLTLRKSSHVIALAGDRGEALQDWEDVQRLYRKQVEQVGSTRFSDHHLLALFEALWEQEHGHEEQQGKAASLSEASKGLFQALMEGNKHVISKLLSLHGPSLLNCYNDVGRTPLHMAVALRDIDLCKLLLAKGADLNQKEDTDLKWTPLHIACHYGDLSMCEFLLKQPGIGVLVISKDNTLPLHYLVAHSFGAQADQQRSVLSLMIENGASVNSQTLQGLTPIHKAVMKHNMTAVSFLLEHGADVNLSDNRGNTALHYAVKSGSKPLVQLLLDSKVDLQKAGEQGTARELALATGRQDFVQMIDAAAIASHFDALVVPIASSPSPPECENNRMTGMSNDTMSSSVLPEPVGTREPSDWTYQASPVTEHSGKGNTKDSACSSTSSVGVLSTDAEAGNSMSDRHRRRASIALEDQKAVSQTTRRNSSEDAMPTPFLDGHGAPHLFTLMRFNVPSFCGLCNGFVWSPVGKQGYMCTVCGFLCHKKCRKQALFTIPCQKVEAVDLPEINVEQPPRKNSSPFPSYHVPSSGTRLHNAAQLWKEQCQRQKGLSTDQEAAGAFVVSQCQSWENEEQQKQEEEEPTESRLDTINMSAFTKEQLEKIYDQFNEIDSDQTGTISQKDLGKQLGVLMSSPGVTGLLFNVLDPKKTNKVDIKGFADGMAVMMKGTLQQGLEYAFKMIDLDNNGFIERVELQLLVDAIYYSLNVVDIKLPDDATTFMEKIILLMGDTDGKISLQQYKNCVKQNLLFFQSLGLLYSTEAQFNYLTKTNESKKGLSITFGHKEWILVQNMMMGIRRSVGETSALPSREIRPKDHDLQVEYKLAHEPGTLPWYFRDFGPMVFRRIRENFFCHPRAYMFCLGPERLLGNALFLGKLCALCEVVSTARSGSFFFKSNDGRYIVKTLPMDEFLFFRKILSSYYDYVMANPNTLLTRFFGMHQMRRGREEVNFVVMENLFNSDFPIHEQYDLKGSTIDRLVEVDPDKSDPSIALKDLNFKRKLYLGPKRKALLMEQVEKDTRWMASHNITDYSFLVGIHHLDTSKGLPSKGDQLERSIFRKYQGGLLSQSKDEIYYVAIIDNLCQYSSKKKGERFLKSIIHDPTQISAMPPKPYQLRFQNVQLPSPP